MSFQPQTLTLGTRIDLVAGTVHGPTPGHFAVSVFEQENDSTNTLTSHTSLSAYAHTITPAHVFSPKECVGGGKGYLTGTDGKNERASPAHTQLTHASHTLGGSERGEGGCEDVCEGVCECVCVSVCKGVCKGVCESVNLFTQSLNTDTLSHTPSLASTHTKPACLVTGESVEKKGEKEKREETESLPSLVGVVPVVPPRRGGVVLINADGFCGFHLAGAVGQL